MLPSLPELAGFSVSPHTEERTHEALRYRAMQTVTNLLRTDLEDPAIDMFSARPDLRGFVAGIQKYDEETLTNFSSVQTDGQRLGIVVNFYWTTAPGRREDAILRIGRLTPQETQILDAIQAPTCSDYTRGHLAENIACALAKRIHAGRGSMVIWKKETGTYHLSKLTDPSTLAKGLEILDTALQTDGMRHLHLFDALRFVDDLPVSKRTKNTTTHFAGRSLLGLLGIPG